MPYAIIAHFIDGKTEAHSRKVNRVHSHRLTHSGCLVKIILNISPVPPWASGARAGWLIPFGEGEGEADLNRLLASQRSS